MYPVPNFIKDLLHQDTCKKNIRIHFPDGERSDICNNLIVKDSVSFTESLCSQDALKFGLCEAPKFECETVGVGNIKGARIEVTCELYTDISGQWKNDLQARVTSIPYGIFYVSECKRQADMNHRKIVAYGITSQLNSGLGCVEKAKFHDYYSTSNAKYSFNTFKWIMGNLNMKYYDPAVFDREYLNPVSHTVRLDSMSWGTTGNYKYFTLIFDTVALLFGNGYTAVSELDNLYQVLAFDNGVDAAFEQTCTFLKMFDCPDEYMPKNYDFKFQINWGITNGGSIGFYQRDIPDGELPIIFFGKIQNCTDCQIIVPKSVTVQIKNYFTSEVIDSITINNFVQYPLFTKLTEASGAFDGYNTTIKVYDDDGVYRLKKPSDFNNINYLSAMLELTGNFGRFARDELFTMINLKQQFGLLPDTDLYPSGSLYPQGVTGGKLFPEDYQSCWYDDEYTKPFGKVVCQYKNTSDKECIFNLYLDGFNSNTPIDTYQVYDISNNEIIKGGTFTKATIRGICETIAANISGVRWMPVDFVGRGLPYVESGDTFEILTKSNDSITTIVLNRTLTGEQTLTDSYKSV
jgi:hypothetical protein